MQLKLHNTLTGKKETFKPIDESDIRLYACGPTVYSYAHIGNGRMAVVFDILVKLLKHLYSKVTYASNITDVDDKIIQASKETGENINQITTKFTSIYNEDMGNLGVTLPDIQPKATEHISDMIDLTKILIERGYAYEKEGHVLFHVPAFENYGKLSGRSREEQIAGSRVEIAPFKKDPADFVLWKPSNQDQPGWDSPWGYGRPGWHLECSAMSEKHLGLPFDIHGGGVDLKFPHHENEIAQSCCAHGHENNLEAFAKYWIHNGHLTVNSEKMSKSIGNIALIHDLLKSYDGEVLRLTLLSGHYRQPMDWSVKVIEQSQSVLDRLYKVLYKLRSVEVTTDNVPNKIIETLCDDLNTPKAIAVLNELSKADDDYQVKSDLLAAGKVLGVLQQDPSEWFGYGQTEGLNEEHIEALLKERQTARENKNFDKADEIRKQLDEMGVVIEDSSEGQKWRRVV